MSSLISVLVVEPSDIITEGLRSLLSQAGGYNVLAPMHDTAMLQERLPVLRPDLLIINPTILSSTPKAQIVSLESQRPSMAIVALVYQYVEKHVLDLFRFQLDIRCGRSAMQTVLKEAIQSTKENPDKEIVSDNYELSDRETDVLVLVAKGLSSKEIADKLNISIHTVNSHRKNITHKTGIKSVAGLAVYAMIHNLM